MKGCWQNNRLGNGRNSVKTDRLNSHTDLASLEAQSIFYVLECCIKMFLCVFFFMYQDVFMCLFYVLRFFMYVLFFYLCIRMFYMSPFLRIRIFLYFLFYASRCFMCLHFHVLGCIYVSSFFTY